MCNLHLTNEYYAVSNKKAMQLYCIIGNYKQCYNNLECSRYITNYVNVNDINNNKVSTFSQKKESFSKPRMSASADKPRW